MIKTDVMIPRTAPIVHAISWQAQLAGAVTDLKQLLLATGNESVDMAQLDAAPDFAIRVPQPYLDRIRPGDINDPLLQQVLPLKRESETIPGYLSDPLEEAGSNVQPGIIHKYKGRVLLVLTGACAINCRYCFRRHFPYAENHNNIAQWQQALDYIRADSSISEVIYSGGDPLVNNDRRLRELTHSIAGIPHVKRLRIHSRLPLVIPRRITDELLEWLTETRLQPVMVLHTNHANELDDNVARAVGLLRERQIPLLNQSVLLRGVNDQADTLTELSEKLFELGILPYYLHTLDKVQGAAHFDTTSESARRLLGDLMQRLPGYLVPKLVSEIPGKGSKIPLQPLL